MSDRGAITIEKLRELLILDEATGTLFWRRRPAPSARSFNSRFAGKPALNASHIGGYLCGAVEGVRFLAHRVVFAMHHGRWPVGEIDHINGKRTDNRPPNLREATPAENRRNMSLSKRNSSGRIGVSWISRNRKWRAGIVCGGKQVWLGLFDTFEEAVAVRSAAEKDLGYHPNHGRAAA